MKYIDRTTVAVIALITVLVIIIISLIFKGFDVMVSLDYCRGEQEQQWRQQRLLESLLLRTGGRIPRPELTKLIKEDYSGNHLVKEKTNQISIDNVIFKFSHDELIEVVSTE